MSGVLKVGSIVEGHGELAAVPILIRRIAREIFGQEVEAQPPHRLARSKMLVQEELGRAITLQTAKAGHDGLVLVMFDADDSDPEEAQRAVEDIARNFPGHVEVVVAVKEFEAWFLAALPSLTSHKSVRDDATYEIEPERRRDCKKEIELCMTESYSEMRHQASFSTLMDLTMASGGSPSFGRLVAAIGRAFDGSQGD